jgi:hypothetical protein
MHLTERINNRWHVLIDGENLMPLYWNIFLRGIGMGLVSLFTPLFIYFIGGIKLVALYVIIQRVLVFFTSIETTKIIERIGFRYSVLLGSLFLVVVLGLPAFFGNHAWVVYLMAIFSAPAITFYWKSRNSMMSIDGEGKRMGKETGIVHLLDRGSQVLAPFVGGTITQLFGFSALFGVGMIIFVASCIPLFFSPHHVKGDHVSWLGFVKWLRTFENRGAVWGIMGQAIDGFINLWFWPIYFYLAISNFEKLGGLVSIAMFLSMIMAFFAGRGFDQNHEKTARRFYLWGVVLSLLRLIRAFLNSWQGLFGLDMVTKLTSMNYYVPLDGYMYERGKKQISLEFFTYREAWLSLVMVFFAVLVFFLANVSWLWWFVFGTAGVGVLLGLKMKI